MVQALMRNRRRLYFDGKRKPIIADALPAIKPINLNCLNRFMMKREMRP